jgi:hypothetical protein
MTTLWEGLGLRKSGVKALQKQTATLLVPLHRIPPPKEAMKMFRGESPLKKSIACFKK